MSERARFGRNLATLVSGEVLSRGLTFVAFTRLARVLDPGSYGRVELALAVMIFLTLVVDLGLGVIGTREIAGRGVPVVPLMRRVVSAQLLLAVAVYGLLGLALFCLPLQAVLTRLLLVFGLSLFGFPFVLPWVFQGWNQMTPVAVLQVLRQAVFAAVALSAVHGPADLHVLPWAEVAGAGVAALGYVGLLWRAGEPVTIDLRAGWDPPLVRESLPIGGSQLVWAARMYLPIVLIAATSGQAAVGFFGAAHRIVMVGQTIVGVYFTTLFPEMSEVSVRSPEALATLLHRSGRWVLWPMVAVAAATTLAAPPFMGVVFGSQFMRREASTTLAVLIWILPILALRRNHRGALITLNHQGEELVCSLLGLALLVAVTLPLGARYGSARRRRFVTRASGTTYALRQFLTRNLASPAPSSP